MSGPGERARRAMICTRDGKPLAKTSAEALRKWVAEELDKEEGRR